MKFFKSQMNQFIETAVINTVVFGPMLASFGLMSAVITEERRRNKVERDIRKQHPNARIQWPTDKLIGSFVTSSPKISDATSGNEISEYKP